MQSAPGVTCNKTTWHDQSKRSNTAPTPAIATQRSKYLEYTITPSKFHGHRGRGTLTACLQYGVKCTRGCRIFLFYFQDSILWITCSALLPHRRCKTQESRQSYAALRNSQVVSISSDISVSKFRGLRMVRTC